MKPLWKVEKVTLSFHFRKFGPQTYYKYHVEGYNLENGNTFSWTVPTLDDEGYDLSTAVIDQDAMEVLKK